LFVSIGAGLLFGLVPALRVSAPNLNLSLKEAGRGSATASQNRMRAGLIVTEVALALILLAGAGLLVRSLLRLLNVDPGFNSGNVLVLDMSLSKAKYPVHSDARSRFLHQLFERLEALPGVEAAGMASSVPMLGWSNGTSLKRTDQPEQDYYSEFNSVSGKYFHALGIPLLQDRVFSTDDDFTHNLQLTTPPVVIINQALAKQLFPDDGGMLFTLQFGGVRCRGGMLRSRIQRRGSPRSGRPA